MNDGSILVVDDDPLILETVAEALEFEGHSVRRAANGAEALGEVERSLPALILLDMRMPVLDGWGFARELGLREIKVPILVMTAARDAHEWAAQIGADGAVAKPFDLPDLLEAVDMAIAR